MANVETSTAMEFFDENVKIYGGGFNNLNSSTDYKICDYFSAIDAISSETLYFSNHIETNAYSHPRFTYSSQYLSVNLYNDLLIKLQKLSKQISTEISTKSKAIDDIS